MDYSSTGLAQGVVTTLSLIDFQVTVKPQARAYIIVDHATFTDELSVALEH